MGYFNNLQIEINELVEMGYSRKQIMNRFDFLDASDLDFYFGEEQEPSDPEVQS